MRAAAAARCSIRCGAPALHVHPTLLGRVAHNARSRRTAGRGRVAHGAGGVVASKSEIRHCTGS